MVDREIRTRTGLAMNKQILYYDGGTHPAEINELCRAQLTAAHLPIISVTLSPLDFGDVRIVMTDTPGVLTMHRQIVAGLEAATADIVFMCESDVRYSPSHFEITPDRADTMYYNTNVWRVRWSDKLAVWTDDLRQTSGLCASRAILLDFYTARVEQIQTAGFDRHYEPRGVRVENWMSREPNLCIRHGHNLTKSKWSADEFRNQKYAAGWKTSNEIWKVITNG